MCTDTSIIAIMAVPGTIFTGRPSFTSTLPLSDLTVRFVLGLIFSSCQTSGDGNQRGMGNQGEQKWRKWIGFFFLVLINDEQYSGR